MNCKSFVATYKPKLSIIVPTYNRADTLARALDSIFAQTYHNFEIIVVNDGSTDNTVDVLKAYNDSRLRAICHERNRGVTATKNTGLDSMRGDWFTFLDDDDEMIATALETMLKVPWHINHAINAVTCNCIDSVTGEFSGKGLMRDQYLNQQTIVTSCRGEYWGLTKTSLLGDDRFNEALPGMCDTLWYKIHKGLRVYHTEGSDRLSAKIDKTETVYRDIRKKAMVYRALRHEDHYLLLLGEYRPRLFMRYSLHGFLCLQAVGDYQNAGYYYRLLKRIKSFIVHKITLFCTIAVGSIAARYVVNIIDGIKLMKYRLRQR
jgi:glycosyltransferase involved in cell wall biosynthesis